MNILNGINFLRYKIRDIGTTYQFADAELYNNIELAFRSEGFSSFGDVPNEYIPLIITLSAYYCCMGLSRLYSEEINYKTGIGMEITNIMVDREPLSKHYLELAKELWAEVVSMKDMIFSGKILSDLSITTCYDKEWEIQKDDYGEDNSDWKDGEVEETKY